MPEIYTFFFDMCALSKLFQPRDKEILDKFKEYEKMVEQNMEQNRSILFGE